MNKQAALDTISKEIITCDECHQGTIGVAVPGEGNPDAAIVFVGEAPGKQEAKTGRPFIGRSGKLLRSAIRDVLHLDDEKDIYITSPVKYLPRQGTPSPDQIAHGRIHLLQQLSVIDPQLIVLMGSVAVQGVLQEKVAVKTRHGTTVEKEGRTYFITVHPAAGLRFPPLRKVFQDDFVLLRELSNNFRITR